MSERANGLIHAFRAVCQNTECRYSVLARIHIVGVGIVTVPCPKCRRTSRYEWTLDGVRGSVDDPPVDVSVSEG